MNLSNVIAVRKGIKDGTRSVPTHETWSVPPTEHIKYFLDGLAHHSNTSIQKSLELSRSAGDIALENNKKAMLMLIAITHRAIIRRDSPFSSVKDTVLFNIHHLQCDTLKRLLSGESGVSQRLIGELIDAIHGVVLLGIYVEMCDGTRDGEIVYSGMIDNGSKIRKTKEYAGVGVKFPTRTGSMCRVINFVRCARKDGLTMCKTLLESYESFNNEILSLKETLKNFFPVKKNPLPLLHVENQEGIAVDGALISKDKQLSQRIKQHNPRCVVTWCCDHRANLVAKDASSADEMVTLYDVNNKLYDFVNSSARVSDLF